MSCPFNRHRQLDGLSSRSYLLTMTKRKNPPGFRGHRFPAEIIQHAVWLYYRFSSSLRDVEDMLAERGITVSHETVRFWVMKFGHQYAKLIRRDRPPVGDKWHLDDALPGRVCVHTREGRHFDPR